MHYKKVFGYSGDSEENDNLLIKWCLMLMKYHSRDKILNLMMLVSFINFSRAFKVIPIESPDQSISKVRDCLQEKGEILLFFSCIHSI